MCMLVALHKSSNLDPRATTALTNQHFVHDTIHKRGSVRNNFQNRIIEHLIVKCILVILILLCM